MNATLKLANSFLELAATADTLMRDPHRVPEQRKQLRNIRKRNLEAYTELIQIDTQNKAEAEAYYNGETL